RRVGKAHLRGMPSSARLAAMATKGRTELASVCSLDGPGAQRGPDREDRLSRLITYQEQPDLMLAGLKVEVQHGPSFVESKGFREFTRVAGRDIVIEVVFESNRFLDSSHRT